MSTIPRSNYRDVELSFDEFFDVCIIGMAGFSDHLMEDPSYPFSEGMVNYLRVADALGLRIQQNWIEQLGFALENRTETLTSHDSAPEGQPDDGHWVYLNSGFDRLAKLLLEKYYVPRTFEEMTFEEFGTLLMFELAGMAQDRVADDGGSPNRDGPVSFELHKTASHLGFPSREGWISRLSEEWLHANYIAKSTHLGEENKYSVTREGALHAERSSDRVHEIYSSLSGKPSELFFSVDASHISRLGLELVAKQETAVAELVKNGYDADATVVDLVFSTELGQSTYLEIFDNGSGMTMDQLKSGFMRLSTPNKVAAPRSEVFQRQKAGRKGIGRFAAQRLGRRLVLETTTRSLDHSIRVEIFWDEFAADRNLSSVPITTTRVAKSFQHGTRLTIFQLRDPWSDAQIERSHRHIAELIQPFPLASTTSAVDIDPGFKATFARARKGDLEIIADDWSLYFKHALAEIEGTVDATGAGSWSVKSVRLAIDNQFVPIGPGRDSRTQLYPHLRNVKFKAYYYIDKETQRAFRSKVAEKLNSSGGIRLYRNGFRVLPYGDRFDDWLKLNASNLLRKVLPPHSNRNFLGFVEINDVDGTHFEETSSREGLLENEDFVELKDFVSSALKSAIMPIAAARDKKLTTTDTRQKRRSPAGQAKDILERLDAFQKAAGDNPEYSAALAHVVQSVRQSILDVGQTGDDLLEELGMMRVLASMGLTIGEFTHEIRLALESVKASASLLAKDLANAVGDDTRAAVLLDQIADFEGYLTFFDITVRDNVNRDVMAIEIRDAVNSFVKVVTPKETRKEIKLECLFEGYGLFTRPMHKSEWSSILINLFTNSVKAIRRAGVEGKIRISCGREDGLIYLDFMDNGDGIPEAHQGKIFDAFFTTTSANGASDEDGTFAGMGMGLKIVRDIVETAGGAIDIKPPVDGFSVCFRVTVPEATDEELPDNAY